MSTRIMVVKLREVIKTSIFAVLGVIILCVLIYLFIPKNESKTSYNPGVYSSEIVLHSNPVLVEVVVSKDEILDISLLNMGETQEVFYPLFTDSIDEVSREIIRNQSTDIEASTDKSMTTQILVKAVDKALEKAIAS